MAGVLSISHQPLCVWTLFSSTPIVNAEDHFHFFNSSLLLVYACSACLSLLGSSWVPFRSSWAPHIDWSSCSPFDARSSQKLIPHLHLVVSIWPPCLAAQNERWERKLKKSPGQKGFPQKNTRISTFLDFYNMSAQSAPLVTSRDTKADICVPKEKMTLMCFFPQDLKDYMKKAGEITYSTVNRENSGEG